jgi:mono/diheme cytochrome c family protein
MSSLNSIPRRECKRSASFAIPPYDRTVACTIWAHVLVLVLFVGISVQVRADDPHLGVIEYEISCMPCHGVDGQGDGRLAHSLKTAPADLTQIAKSNGGEFPFTKVAEVIDGLAIVAAHGQREMPVWGERYRRAIETNEPPAAIERRAREQIAALVRYIESIQAK